MKSNNDNKYKLERLGKSPIYNFILVLAAACLVVYIINIIAANQIISKIRTEGIAYESFREIKVSDDFIESLLNPTKKKSSDPNKSSDSKSPNSNGSSHYDEFDILTLYMLVYNYDTLDFNIINKNNTDLILRSLVYDETFRQLKDYYISIFKDIETFPVLQTNKEATNVSFKDTWNAHRSYGGDRRHEGTDLMAIENVRGKLKVVSMTDGVVEKKGWLEKGGYRIGIRSGNGTYFYYAHLDSYGNNINIGDSIEAGEFIGYMGDSGYGPKGTKGQFDVHLHLGIYIDSKVGEISVNPYYILNYLEKNIKVLDLVEARIK